MQKRLLSDVAARKYPDSALPAGNVELPHSGEIQVQPPDPIAPFRLASAEEKRRRIRDVLQLAWRIYRGGKRSMVDSVNDAADDMAARESAKISLRRIVLELNLTAWEEHPARSRRDVHALFRKAIGRLTPHRGGWQVSR